MRYISHVTDFSSQRLHDYQVMPLNVGFVQRGRHKCAVTAAADDDDDDVRASV